MNLIYKARTSKDRAAVKNKVLKELTTTQKENLSKKYAAYAIQTYKEQGGAKKFGNTSTALIVLKCQIFFNNYTLSQIYKDMSLHDKGRLYLENIDKEEIAKKAKTILKGKSYKIDAWGSSDLKIWTVKKKK
ncbi:hypothetical protein BTH160X_40051 [Brochothrix thermosphacta]|uniref:hypothetical protein n=1 Tax=Brochothrix thermosphacta TaxID=2756 RepID=UPI000D113835|nr:hypothetical protein [Brochothrix thermosphacta]SOC27793.1 hypothetical protein BTH160X_40051 [Brochothrix thermosphacta]